MLTQAIDIGHARRHGLPGRPQHQLAIEQPIREVRCRQNFAQHFPHRAGRAGPKPAQPARGNARTAVANGNAALARQLGQHLAQWPLARYGLHMPGQERLICLPPRPAQAHE